MVQDEVNNDTDVILIPPFIHLTGIQNLIGSSKNIFLGAQNCHQNQNGAFTGEISAGMLVSCGATHVILGHSERREYFGETDELLAEKVSFALENQLIPIFCCGEKLEVREAGKHEDLVSMQVEKALFGLSEDQISKVVIAYEPVWAIGTGKVAAPEDVAEMHQAIAAHLAALRSGKEEGRPAILYGGSVKAANAAALFALPYVDGALVGGASLKISEFAPIVQAAQMLLDAK